MMMFETSKHVPKTEKRCCIFKNIYNICAIKTHTITTSKSHDVLWYLNCGGIILTKDFLYSKCPANIPT